MAIQEYEKALRMGERAFRSASSRGEDPYLPALDDLLQNVEVQTEVNLGLVDIPLDQIVGTRTVGRQNCFASNFMPLMPAGSEFASKWSHVYSYQMSSGVSDPIVAYEFMNRFYVMEGNKRVSVLKYVNSTSIEGTVTRIIPKRDGSEEIEIYYEFLDFYRRTGINYLWFSKKGSFDRLTKAVGKEPEEVWSEDERRDFRSFYTEVSDLIKSRGTEELRGTLGDALLFYITIYPWEELKGKKYYEKKADISRIWKELTLLNSSPEDALVLKPADDTEAGLFARFFTLTSSKRLNVTFIYDRAADNSSWTYAHELGRLHLEEVFGSRIKTSCYSLEEEGTDVAALLERAVKEGSHIIFATHQKFLGASLKTALEHPEVKILTCAVNRPYGALRTYYGRMYEAKFLCGMVAGAMCENDKIAYLADYPIYGSFANINAFARGAQMTNPRAKVYLHWASDTTADLDKMLREQRISLISDMDMIRPSNNSRRFGLYFDQEGRYQKLATPIWDWGKFYERIIRDILRGVWNKSPEAKERKALNYWWGISGDIIDLIMSQSLPAGIRKLTQIMREEIYEERFHPFGGVIWLQDGTSIGAEGEKLSPEEIITMNWLAQNVVGEIPAEENLTKEARMLTALQSSLALPGKEEA